MYMRRNSILIIDYSSCLNFGTRYLQRSNLKQQIFMYFKERFTVLIASE